MIVNELLLDSSVVPFNICINLRTPGIGEDMKDTIFFEILVEVSQILRSIIRLPGMNHSRVKLLEMFRKRFHGVT